MGIGPLHLFVLAAIALLFFGPSKLPGLGKSMGEAIKGFKDAMNDVNSETDTIKQSVQAPPSRPQVAPGPFTAPGETNVVVTETTAEHVTDPLTPPKPKTPVS